jgi:hypothetical protein
MESLAVYTVLTGEKEPLGNPIERLGSFETDLKLTFICFTDNPRLSSDVWDCRLLDRNHLPPEISSRRPKALPHEYLNNFAYSLYLDNICQLKRLPTSKDLVKHNDADYVYRMFQHSTRNNLVEEALAIASLGYEQDENLIAQLENYSERLDIRTITPLSTGTVILREHTQKRVIQHGIMWWEHILKYSKRDQMSFDFCRIITDLKVNYFEGNKFDNSIIHAHSNLTRERTLANFDPKAHKRLSTQKIRLSNNLSTPDGEDLEVKSMATRQPCDLEMLSYFLESGIGKYHYPKRAITAYLQELLAPTKSTRTRLFGLYFKTSETASFSQLEFESSQKVIELYLGAKSATNYEENELQSLLAVLSSLSNEHIIVCVYNLKPQNKQALYDAIYSLRLLNNNVLTIAVPVSFYAGYQFTENTRPANMRFIGFDKPDKTTIFAPDGTTRTMVPSRPEARNVMYCDGGLANRIYTLMFGMLLSRKFGHRWSVSWPLTNNCQARLLDLFEVAIDIDEHPISFYQEYQKDYQLLVHDDFGHFDSATLIDNRKFESYLGYAERLDNGPVFYTNNTLPGFVTAEDVASALSELVPVKSIKKKAQDFVLENQIDGNTIGLHIRKTDFGDKVDEYALATIAAKTNRKFFICSDSEEALSLFRPLKNCSLSPAVQFPSKLNGLTPWGTPVLGQLGTPVGNIDRSASSVEDALVDLLVLSKTTLVHTSNSSFLRLALLLKTAGV